MTFRGYREANQELQRLNEQLARQRDALEAVNRELESFSYSVSHDLRAPLRSIDGFSQALLEDCAEVLDESGKAVSAPRPRGGAGDGAADRRPPEAGARGAGRDRSGPTSTSARSPVGSATGCGAGARSARSSWSSQEGVHGIGDASLLGVLLENLLGNAWKFTSKRDSARIEFGSSEGARRSVYFVRDNGAGFDMAYASKLFGTFQRLHAASEFQGTGIGLATVRRIVQRARRERSGPKARSDRGPPSTSRSALAEGSREPGRRPTGRVAGSKSATSPTSRWSGSGRARWARRGGLRRAVRRGLGDRGLGDGAKHRGPRRGGRGAAPGWRDRSTGAASSPSRAIGGRASRTSVGRCRTATRQEGASDWACQALSGLVDEVEIVSAPERARPSG